MTTFKSSVLALALGVGLIGFASAAQAQTVGYNVRTGDVWVDSRLGEINDYGSRYRDPFINEMTGNYGAPRPLVVELLEQRRWAPADVYYACAIARALNVPCRNVVQEYDRNPGQGWGVVAQRMGIKPGSPAFHALKRGTVATYNRWGYPIVVDRAVRVDWSKHGPGAHKGAHAVGKPVKVVPAHGKAHPATHGAKAPAKGKAKPAAPGKKGGSGQGKPKGNGHGKGG